jgi:KipI family sensor histidine kinase inhibitor
MIYDHPKFLIMGDRSLLVEVGDEISIEVNRRVRLLYYSLNYRKLTGIIELLPSYTSLLIVFDPLVVSLSAMRTIVDRLVDSPNETGIPEPKTVKIPVVYGGEFGPDLTGVADYHGLSPSDVVRCHTSAVYQVYMIGFTPGYPYMGEVPREIATPRRDTPRTHVPKGSVGIAQKQTGIYPVESPGGWQIIGRTPLTLFDPYATPPALLEAGDIVTFYPIEKEEFETWRP